MFNVKKGVLSASLAVSALIMSSAGHAETLRGESGSDRSLGTIVMQTTAKELGGGDLSLTVNSQQTLTRSALKLAAGKIDVAITPPNAWRAMTRGAGPFKKNAAQATELAPNMRSLYAFVAGTFHPTVWADSDIKDWDDIKGKRVFMGPPGGSAGKQISGLIRVATGYEPEVDYDVVKLGWGAAISAFQDGQFDVLMSTAAVGSAAITQLGLVREIRILSLTQEELESEAYAEFLVDNGGVPGAIPAGTYEGQINSEEEILSSSFTMLTTVHKDMSDEQAYALTAAFQDNIDETAKSVAILSSVVGVSPFAGNPMPLHPGAIKYYQDKGLDVPSELIAE